MVGSRHKSLHHKGAPHRVVDTSEIRNAMVRLKLALTKVKVVGGFIVPL